MPIVTWNDKLSVKVKEIDEQHKKLIAMINMLNDEMLKGKGNEALGKILDALVRYTEVHFKFEENYFDKYNYPQSIGHKQQHQKLIGQVVDLRDRFESGKIGLTMETMGFLKTWLTDHIMGTDQKYSEFFNRNGLN